MLKPLTIKQEAFVCDYIKHGDASRAYRFAFDTSRMKPETVTRSAFAELQKPNVAARVAELRASVAKKAEFGVLEVLADWVAIATADPNEIMRHQRRCCRHCYGLNHQYQWIEMEYAMECVKKLEQSKAPPECDGGFGFDGRLSPHENCPMCAGQGVGSVYIADTDKLTGSARRLYGGVKQTRNGVEVILRDQDGALEKIAKFLGMNKDGFQMPGGSPLPNLRDVTKDPVEAARIYSDLMLGG